MNPARKCRIVLVTAPDMSTARKLARTALTRGLIACANLVPRVESHYRWQGRLERSNEIMMLLKTTASRIGALEKLIVAEHPYDTPEFIVVAIEAGNSRYLDWLGASVVKLDGAGRRGK